MLLEADSLWLARNYYRLVEVPNLRRSGTRGRVDWFVGDGQVQDGCSGLSCLLVWMSGWGLVVGMSWDFAGRSSEVH